MARSSPPSGWPPEALPRWLSRECAAFYLGMSPTHLDSQVRTGALPQPHQMGRLVRFDRWELDVAVAKMGRKDKDEPVPQA